MRTTTRKLLTALVLAGCLAPAGSAFAGRPNGDPLLELRQLTTLSQKLWNDLQTGNATVTTDVGRLQTDSLGLLVPSKHAQEAVAVRAEIVQAKQDLVHLNTTDRRERRELVNCLQQINNDPATRGQLQAMLVQARGQLAASDRVVREANKQVATAVAKAWHPVLPPSTTDPTPAPGLTG
jgi:hypothetical protein